MRLKRKEEKQADVGPSPKRVHTGLRDRAVGFEVRQPSLQDWFDMEPEQANSREESLQIAQLHLLEEIRTVSEFGSKSLRYRANLL